MENWWGDISFVEGQLIQWSIGERKILIQRHFDEWHCWNIETQTEIDLPIKRLDIDTLDGPNVTPEVTAALNEQIDASDNLLGEALPLPEKMSGRYLEQGSHGQCRVTPLLADRSIVARPSTPLTLLAGEKTKLYVSTPIWFSATTLPDEQRFVDVPFWRPSDSWFGASTIDGQLCYAKFTSAKVRLEQVETRSHRAVTPITVVNNQDKALVIERLNVPVNLLHLYYDVSKSSAGGFWTSEIVINTDRNSNDVELDIINDLPTIRETAQSSEALPEYELVSKPRVSSEQNKFIRNISNLLG